MIWANVYVWQANEKQIPLGQMFYFEKMESEVFNVESKTEYRKYSIAQTRRLSSAQAAMRN